MHANGWLRNVRWLWQCCVLPAVFALATVMVVTNRAAGATSNSATLDVVDVAPTIATQPVDQTVTAGQTATFTVMAAGTVPLRYQWQQNGVNIAGATSASYTTAVTTTLDSGSTFTVAVSNTAGTVTSAAAALTVDTSLVASYSFEEGTDATTVDSSGNNNVGSLVNGPTWTTGKIGKALSFAGPSNPQYVNIGNGTSLRITGSLTIGAWIYITSFPANDAAIVSKRSSVSRGYQLDVTPDTGSRTLGFKLTSSSNAKMMRYGATTLQVNRWYYMVGVYDATATSMNVYLDGRLDNGFLSGVVTSTQTDSSENVNIGRKPSLAGFEFAGTIDEVRMFSRALSAGDVQALYNDGLGSGVTAPAITSPTTASGTMGNAFSYQITATNSATIYTASGLPAGLTVNAGTGLISGTPAGAGTSIVTLGATNSGGTGNATLALTVNAAAVAPTITTAPGNQTVTAGQTATFTVTAAGTAPVSYQWQKSGVNIAGAASASYTTAVTTTADSGSTFDAVATNAAGTVTSAAATLTVNPAVVPGIQVSSNAINFLNDVVGSNSSQALIISNVGTAPLTIAQVAETGSAFSLSGFSLPLNVNVGQQTTITVAFQPTVVGGASGNISIVSNAPSSPTPVTLSGTGIAATLTLGISPTNLSFGNVTTGTSSGTQSITITNTGNSSATISQINLSGTDYTLMGGSAPFTLTPTQNITLIVMFSPTTAGAVSDSIAVVSDATGSPATIALSGTGVTLVQHTVALTWNVSTSTVSGYNVYRSTVSGSSYTMLNTSLVAVLNYTDATVVSGTTYYYVTTAVDSSGNESAYSDQVSALIP